MIRKVAAIFALCIFIFSCSTQHVVSDHAIQKRKYRPGLFVSKKSKSVEQEGQSGIAEVKRNEALSHPEEYAEAKTSYQLESSNKKETKSDQAPEKKAKKANSLMQDPVAVSQRIIDKFVPMQYASGFSKQLGKLSAAQDLDSDGTSLSAIIGCALGGAAVASFLTGIMTVEIGFGVYLLILAIVLAIPGLIFSIKGAIESGRNDVKGTVLSIIGTVSNGIIVVAGLIVAFFALLVLAIFAGCN